MHERWQRITGARDAEGYGVAEPSEGLVRRSAAPSWLARPGARIAWYLSAIGLERWARIGAVALTPLLLTDVGLRTHGPLLVGLAAYVLLTILPRRDRYLRASDLVIAAVLIVMTGPEVVGFLPFLLVAVAGPAAQSGMRAGLLAGGALSVILVVGLVAGGELQETGVAGIVPVALLLLLSGVTTATASEVLEDRAVRDRLVLQQANRLLSSLRDIAEDIPGGLDVGTVSASLIAELRSVPGAVAALVLVLEPEELRPTATTGLGQLQPPPVPVASLAPLMAADPRLHGPHTLPRELREACATHHHWMVIPLGEPESPVGTLLAGFDDLEAARAARPRLSTVAHDAGLALENAQLFGATQAQAAETARRRVAGDLHDSVAQSLAHLRMELELLAREHRHEDPELARLARVAEHALTDLRGTINELRAPLASDLGALLAEHVADLQTPHGPHIEFERAGHADLTPDRVREVLRVAQEAISNAMRHAHAEHIVVTLEQDERAVTLSIEDDGVGLDGPREHRSESDGHAGVGLSSMRERADRLHGELHVRARAGRGTVVTLTLPTDTAVPVSSPHPVAGESR